MNYKKVIITCLVISILHACSFFKNEESKATLIEKDRVNLNEAVSTNTAMLYKFIKVSFKLSNLDDSEVKVLQQDHPEVEEMYEGAAALAEILNKTTDSGGNREELSVMDYINTYRNYSKTKEAITAFDEDVLPSFFQSATQGKQLDKNEIQKNKALEHCVFASFSIALKDLGLPICFYELSKIEPNTLPNKDYKINYITARNIMLYVKGLYYLSEHELTGNINWMNENPEVDFKGLYYIPQHLKSTLGGKERAIILIHNYILRGLDRLKMDNELSEKEALEDFESTIRVAKEADIDNEIIQAVEVYFYLKNENSEKAILALKRLKKSEILSKNEKKSIDEAILYLEKRETGKVLNGVYDKALLGKIVISYIHEQAKQVDWEKVFEESGIEIPKEVKQAINSIEDIVKKTNEYSNKENIEKAKENIKETGKDLFKKTKEWLE